MTILVAGATGKVGRSLVKRLHEANARILLATRSRTVEPPSKAVKFDWFDEKTYAAPFEADPNIDKIFLIQPDILIPCSSALEKGDFVNGRVHEYLADRGVDYVILRPTSFTACGDSKVAYVSVDDIVQVACDALFAEKTTNNDVFIVGPQLYSHDGKLTSEEFQKALLNFGMEEKYAGMLGYIHGQIASGNEAAVTKTPNAYVGKYSLPEYFKAHKDTWIKA
ncbi:hypothetical protein BDN70DRAFT_899219 [Pholiota conissans]|uniref:NAD-dependent epimerase/dehydratase domain-containing protein n=1 Tax=Pholiota conissans TaxID=109636 RepID=A0A9P5YRK6_9AGAR|nr:hypothetical protein BDN70DRAFT_899219 [Pholiota conissans]